MTSQTSRSTGAIPLLTSQRPKTFARWTSPSRQVGPGALAKVLVLDASGTPWSWRECGLFAPSGLNAGLFVGGNNIVIRTQMGHLPKPVRKDRGSDRLNRRSWDREGRSRFDVATGGGHPC